MYLCTLCVGTCMLSALHVYMCVHMLCLFAVYVCASGLCACTDTWMCVLGLSVSLLCRCLHIHVQVSAAHMYHVVWILGYACACLQTHVRGRAARACTCTWIRAACVPPSSTPGLCWFACSALLLHPHMCVQPLHIPMATAGYCHLLLAAQGARKFCL